jgi:hypothetical protein
MDPITMGLLTGAAGNLVQGIGKIVPSAFEIEQNKRLKKLQEQEAAGILGLNASERSILENRLASRGDAAVEQAKQERERYLAGGGGATAGANMLSAQIGEGALRQQGTAISQAVEEANLAKAAVQSDEIRALEAAKAQYASDRLAALVSIAGGAIEGGITSSANKAAESGAKNPSSNALSAVGKLYGLNDDQARGLLEITASNPEAAKLFGKLK